MARNIFSLSVGVAACLTLTLAGCSREAKKTRLLTKADEYYKAGEYEKAEIEYKNVLQTGGLDPKAIVRLGTIYFEQGRLVQSAAALRKALELQPDNIDAKLKLGYVYLATGGRAQAREAAIFVLDRRPNDPDAPILLVESMEQSKDAVQARELLLKLPSAQSAPVLTALSLISLRERKLHEAETLAERARQADPKFPPVQSTFAALHMARKDPERAGKAFAAAAELSPPRSPARLQFAHFNIQNGKADVAKQQLDEMLKTTPDFLPAYIMRASISLEEKKYDETIGLIEKLLTRDPIHPDGLLLAARARTAKGEIDQAITLLEKAAGIYTQSAQIHLQLGNAYVTKGNLESAAASFSKAIGLVSTYAEAILALAQVNIRQRNFLPAINSLKAFLERNPKNGDAQLLLAEAYRHQGSFNESLAVYRQLAESNPFNPQLQLFIGVVLLQQNKKDEARQAFIRATELSPTFLPAVEQLVNLDLTEKQYAPAIKRITSYIGHDPKSAAAQLILGKIHLLEGNGEKAEAALKKTIDLEPDSSAAHSLLAGYYVRSNQVDKAVAALRLAVSRNPKEIGSLMQLARLYEHKKEYAAARESYEKLLAINPKVGEALNNLATLYTEHFNELDKAQEMAQQARELLSNRAETTDTLGWILLKKGQYARAFALLNESAEKLPELAEARYHLGMAHYMMGNEDEARMALEKALQMNGAFPGADSARQNLVILSINPVTAGERERSLIEQAVARQKDDPVASARLAALHEREGNAEKAFAIYDAALKANSSNTTAALNMIRMYRARNETTKALELAKATRALAPADGNIAHVLGRLAFESGDHLWSVGVLQDAARRQESNPDVLYDLAEANFSIGQIEAAERGFKEALAAAKGSFSRAREAREYLELIAIAQSPADSKAEAGKVEKALLADKGNVAAIFAKATLDEQKGDIQAAKQRYNEALSRYPDFAPAKRQLTLIYAKHPDDDKKALELAGKARDAYPSDPDVAKAFGILLFREASYARATTLLLESARTRGTDAELMYYLGMSQHHLKDQAGSKRSLERALELKLTGKLAEEARRALTPAKK